MQANPKVSDPKIAADPVLHRVLADVGLAGADAERYRGDTVLRKQELFDGLEGGRPARRLICYLTGPAYGSIDLSDAAPFGSMLDAIGKCDNLDLMLNSPGGSGEAAEKLVEMCREHCREQFRVVVPNFAKSAATMISLGADIIVMGYPSELGPTDPQYEISVGNVAQLVSGQSFLQAYETAQDKVREAVDKNESPVGYLQSLASSTLEPAFIEHCRRGVEFSRDIATKFLTDYQLKAKHPRMGVKNREKRALEAADNLLSKNIRFSHGRLIGATEARDEVGLNVQLLDREDPTWEAYWELYVRGEVYMQTLPWGERPPAKLFFDRDSTLPVY
jgi:Serine dehydrogenase proteinase